MPFAPLSVGTDFFAPGGAAMAKPLLPDDLWELLAPLLPRPQTDRRPPGPYRHPVHPQDRPAVGVPAPRDGLRLWHDLLAPPAAVAARRRLDEAARTLAG